ncbi:LysR substrate-binding domain-containing protein [Burkholderia sp. FERM BP-3421]|jgi:LysR family glycine cleavage system transcriptional activator|uniref:LysR substrate-binding domain-containing protein n=1 Tax=Burkholderia sp. FERM BP-3421 TaxID=1494466 RepID=UPI00235FB3F8|nr:LysR substrate-binding domain-containing protein [Burkholderia sp. FERM BP-3421]WDD91543.1 LysR substrate-binding domain-containing protein [Burkholderia sp. FERM BP-3421]
MRLPSLRNLQVFEAAARHQSFREAANSLFLTHGAVGRQVKALEAELGVELFARVGRRVVLTPHGHRLQLAMSSALKLITDTSNELRREAKQSASRLPVTVVPSFATRWLAERLPDFHEQHPEITVELIPTIVPLDLSAKQIPLGIRMGYGNWDGLEAERLAIEYLFPVVAASGVEGFENLPESAQDMLRYPLLNPYDEWERWFKRCGVIAPPMAGGMTYEDSSLLLRAVEERKGIALGRKWLVAGARRDGRLIRLPGPTIRANRDYYLVYPKGAPLPAAARVFVAWLQQEIARCLANEGEG